MKRLLLAIAILLGLADVAAAQNVTCATRPVTDNSNACANTAFVNSYVNNPSSPIYSTAHTWLATQTFSPVSGTAVALNGTLTMYGDVVLTHPLTPTPDNTASSNITLGVGAGAALAPIHSTQYLTLLGFQAGAALTTEDHITAVGAWSLSSYNAGGTNTGITAIGIDAMRNLTSGQQNVAVGEHTLTGATSASYTTAVGYNTMLNFGAGGTYNSAFGYFALGGSSGTPATGLGNTALGSYALVGIAGTGAYNTAVGMQALYAVAQANGNVGIGYQAGLTVTTGYANTIIGTFAGSATLATGHDNILIGTTNNVADTPLSSTSNYLNIGNFIYGTSAGLTISPVTTTSIITPVVYGGTAANSVLYLKGSSNVAPTGDAVAIQTHEVVLEGSPSGPINVYVGRAGNSQGTLYFGGSTSGYIGIGVANAASGFWTLPNATDQFVGRATTDTLTGKSMDGGSNTFTNIPIGSAISGLGTGVATALASGVREKLTANRTYYVRTDGSDSNTGLVDSSGGAFLTWQKAWNVILTLDLGGFTVTVQVRDGTYTGALSITTPAVGGSVIFQGNSTTPANVVLSTTSSDAIFVSGQGHYLTLKDFKVQTTTAGSAIHTDTGAVVNVGNLNFGACAGSHLSAENGSQIVYNNSVAAISGGATSFSAAYNGAQIAFRANTVTLSGTPAFSTAFAFGMVNSSTFIDLNTFSGSATGARYSAILNAVINVSGAGASHLPGDSAGSTATGGQYG